MIAVGIDGDETVLPLILPSASELTRALNCEDSELLKPVIIEVQSAYATRGDTLHDYIFAIGEGIDREEALRRVEPDDPNYPACEVFPISVVPRGGHFEVALAWGWREGKGRVLGYGLGRNYSGADRAEEYVGSFDYMAEVRPGHGAVVDWKSGWRTIPAKDSWQLLFGAVAAADTWGWDSVSAAHLDIRDPEYPRWDTVELDGMALAAARARLRQYAEGRLAQHAINKHVGQRELLRVVEGEHCRYCKVWKACPAKTAIARNLAVDSLQLLPAPGEVTVETLRRAVFTLEKVEELLPRAWKELEAFAKIQPIDLGDGRVMGMAPGRKADKVLDAQRTIAELGEILGEEYAHLAIHTTKGKIEEAAGAYARKEGLALGKTKELTVEALRRKGLIEKQQSADSVQIVKADKVLP